MVLPLIDAKFFRSSRFDLFLERITDDPGLQLIHLSTRPFGGRSSPHDELSL